MLLVFVAVIVVGALIVADSAALQWVAQCRLDIIRWLERRA